MRMRVMLFTLSIALLVCTTRSGAIEYSELVITRAEWPEYANGANIAALPQVRQVLARFDESGRYRVVVRYPGGESGADWAEQLVHWFVAHGIPGDFLQRELGSGDPDRLLLLLIKN